MRCFNIIAFLDSIQETEISEWEVTDFFSKSTFHMNKTFKTWGKSLQLPYANAEVNCAFIVFLFPISATLPLFSHTNSITVRAPLRIKNYS